MESQKMMPKFMQHWLLLILVALSLPLPSQMMTTNAMLSENTILTVVPKSLETCLFDETEYRVGDVWHPFLKPHGYLQCVNCTCKLGGEVECETVDCPKMDCFNVIQRPGQCCPTCLDDLPPDVSKKEERENERLYQDCSHHGIQYQHGAVFASNKTALKPTQDNQCVQCTCADGDVLCRLKTCLPLPCTKLIYIKEDCCPVCEDVSELAGTLDKSYPSNVLKHGETVSKVALGESSYSRNSDCQSGGRAYRNGESWHPVVGPFGKMKCVLCTCERGHVSCRRPICEPEENLTCSDPVKPAGECCKRCLSDADNSTTKESTYSFQLPTNSPRLCAPPGVEYLVYELSSQSEYRIIFRDDKKQRIDQLRWQLQSDSLSAFYRERLNTQDLEMLLKEKEDKKTSLSALGASINKYVSRFKRRVYKYMQHCGDLCQLSTINKLKKKLKLQPPVYSDDC
ncbi:chordin-like protein 1 isoform X2 [Lingula anatina]|uniref:Chordin-like protein 1 isoform X2 n=1 Tax=Lingula anatina TaxID=7574 RepID=A0A1S3JZK1_LINAN|nr:chordin-like protein 1 isoform X2 [Lingula anatina]|eukprot:XP_013415820.1 chordin-like protein 1 isoform X2 [Lingula anatina]